MTVALMSGFALLSLVGGFFLLKKDKNFLSSVSEKVNSSLDVPSITSITDYPYSVEYPDYTGAVYLGDDWFLMANGLYFNRVTKKWSNLPPDSDDDKTVSGVGVPLASFVADLLGTSVHFASELLLIGAGVLGAVLVHKFSKSSEVKK